MTETEPRDYITVPEGDPPACLVDVGERIRIARENARLQQRALAATVGVTQAGVSRWESGERDPGVYGLIRIAEACGVPASSLLPARHQEAGPDDGEGRWLRIAFMGHLEYTGYVTEITKHGQAAYRIDLPEKVWGGNPLAYVTHAATSWFSDRPVTEESVRSAWEAQQERARRRAEQEAGWTRQQETRALEAGDGSDAYPEGPF